MAQTRSRASLSFPPLLLLLVLLLLLLLLLMDFSSVEGFQFKADHRLHFARKYFGTRSEEERGVSLLSGFQRDHRERVLVSIEKNEADSKSAPTRELLHFIETGGGKVNHFGTRSIEAFIPLSLLSSLEEHPNITSIIPLPSFVTNSAGAGSVTSQARRALNIDRGPGNLIGRGVKVGILSDSVNRCPSPKNRRLIGLAASIATGDLPPRNRHNIIKDSSSPCGTVQDEGRAMAEIIYDIAPGVDFLYYMPNSPADFALGIQTLANRGAKIIVDDIRFLSEPIYQDGLVASAIEMVSSRGVIYFTAAGNIRDFAFQSTFNLFNRPVTFDFSAFGMGNKELYCHRFPSGLPFMKLGANAPKTAQFFLTWAVPFYSLGGAPNPIDIDLIVSSTSSPSLPPKVLTVSGLTENSDPWEYSSFSITPTSQISICVGFQVVAKNVSRYLQYRGNPVTFKLQYNQYGLQGVFKGAATIVAQQNAANAITIGAIPYDRTCRAPWNKDRPCVPTVAPYASRGGQLILFNATGSLYPRALNRFKPNFVGPDCGDTSFFYPGVASDIEGNGFPNFCGSSASAPAVAAMAARIVQKCPKINVQKMRQVLRNSAADIGPKGWDTYAGLGLVDYSKAINC